MIRQQSLGYLLGRQWMIYTCLLSGLFIGAGLLLLFVLEDSFIDRRLHAVAAGVTSPHVAPPHLPSQFSVAPPEALSSDLQARLSGRSAGALVEFRRENGRYVHVLLTQTAAREPFAVVYDVTDELTVNRALARGAAYAAALLAVLLVVAHALARVLAGRISRRADALVRQVLESPDPGHLQRLAAAEPVRELSALVRLQGEAWQAHLDAIERERQTLAYLGHELRTPLQSARTSMALIQDDRTDAAAWQRLQRAVNRLTRASDAILWLSSPPRARPDGRTDALRCLESLADELGPLAAVKSQRIDLKVDAGLHWPWPEDVVDVLLSNLMLNAIQHGGPGVITVVATSVDLTLRNPCAPEHRRGSGLGLAIVQRLAGAIGWHVELHVADGAACARVHWPAPGSTSPGSTSSGTTSGIQPRVAPLMHPGARRRPHVSP